MAKRSTMVSRQSIVAGGRQRRRLKRKCDKPVKYVKVAQKQKAPNPLFYLILIVMLLCNAVYMPTDELVFIGSIVICGVAFYCKHTNR